MRTSLSAATLVASVLLIGLTADAQISRAPGAPQSGGTSVAVVDINFIFKNHQRFKQTMNDIKQEIESFDKHLRDQRNEITKKTEQLKNLPAASQSYRDLETEIANMHTQLQLEMNRKRKDILEREARVYFNAYKEIEERVAMFADRNRISLVLRFNSEEMDPTKRESVLQGVNRNIVYQRSLNITKMILDDLNRQTPPPNVRQSGRPTVPRR